MNDSWPRLFCHLGEMHIVMCQHYTCRAPIYGREHTHDREFQYSYLIQGKSIVSVGGKRFNVGSDDAIFTPPGVPHGSYGDRETEFELVEIKFTMGSKNASRAVPSLPPVTHVHNPATIMAVMDRMAAARWLEIRGDSWLIRTRLAELLILLDQESSFGERLENDAGPTDPELRIRRAVYEMSKRYNEPWSVEDLANTAGLSASHFAACFRRIMNVSPIEYLIRLRLHQARELLENTGLSVAQISRICGFSSSQYFARMFLAREKLSPGAYRRGKRNIIK